MRTYAFLLFSLFHYVWHFWSWVLLQFISLLQRASMMRLHWDAGHNILAWIIEITRFCSCYVVEIVSAGLDTLYRPDRVSWNWCPTSLEESCNDVWNEKSLPTISKNTKPPLNHRCYFYKMFCNSREWKVHGIAKTCSLSEKLSRRRLQDLWKWRIIHLYISKNFCDYTDTTIYANKFQCPNSMHGTHTYTHTHDHPGKMLWNM